MKTTDTTIKPTLKPVACKLTTPELRKRKEDVIAALKSKLLDKKELPNGYSYQFKSTDDNLDQLNSFIKTERLCCDFFEFELVVKADLAWLTLTGPAGTKEFIAQELDF